MENLLHDFRRVGNIDFITDLESRLKEYIDFATSHLECGNKTTEGFVYYHADFSEQVAVNFSKNYAIECYDQIEEIVRNQIEKETSQILNAQEREVYIKPILVELNLILNKVKEYEIETELQPYKDSLILKLNEFILLLNHSYMNKAVHPSSNVKIQWLGNTNVLATLFYDLWKGQDKGKDPSTKAMFIAEKKDIEALLLNNFIDEKGKPLSPSTLSDYLNESKPNKRAKKGVRIELGS